MCEKTVGWPFAHKTSESHWPQNWTFPFLGGQYEIRVVGRITRLDPGLILHRYQSSVGPTSCVAWLGDPILSLDKRFSYARSMPKYIVAKKVGG